MAKRRSAWQFMHSIYKTIMPEVNRQLAYWRERAANIPNQELRTQALQSLEDKAFHCEGGAILALVAEPERKKEVIRFICAYQTISDYLDNLCDRSVSQCPDDFTLLHSSMRVALTPGESCVHFYALRDDQDDGGYLQALVETCQSVIEQLPSYGRVQGYCLKLEEMYKDLQVHKHVIESERLPRLQSWWEMYEAQHGDLLWNEFAAATGSTLGIFTLVSYSTKGNLSREQVSAIYNGYFPYVQGLHILLDYIIDEEEDRLHGDLNFVSYYHDTNEMRARTLYFFKQAKTTVSSVLDADVHNFIRSGLVGVYLADPKMKDSAIRQLLLREAGGYARFFYYNRLLYEWYKGWKKKESPRLNEA
ncbi:MAG: tetraprenyl-beta-curcumene synthase family protein [Bacilli bacterium]